MFGKVFGKKGEEITKETLSHNLIGRELLESLHTLSTTQALPNLKRDLLAYQYVHVINQSVNFHSLSVQLDSDGRKARENCPAITSGQQKQILPNTCQTSTDLLQLLRKFLNQLGTILSDEIKWSKKLIEEYMKNGVLKYCQDNSPIISKFEYGGSLYENLKTTRPDEDNVVIHVVLKVKKGFVSFNVNSPGCATIKTVEGSPYKEYSREDGLLMPKKFKSWLFKLVNSAVQELSSKEAASMYLKASSCSTGVKVIISQSKTQTLKVKLVPTFPLSSDEYFVPPSQQGNLPGTEVELRLIAMNIVLTFFM